ncbi:MAG: SpoIIE family protein phosphatase [Candidatus Rokuibacteriota bacterium]
MMDALRVPVVDGSQPAEARRAATTLAAQAGFEATGAGRVALVATEAATNLVKHGAGGEIVVLALEDGSERAIDILALDKGRGIGDLAASRRDGYSTAGSPGTGLGAISRLADLHDIYTQPGKGTALFARVWRAPARRSAAPSALAVGGLAVAKGGEDVCGDSWSFILRPTSGAVMVADGLGHGPAAAEAAREALRTFATYRRAGPAAALEAAHGALRSTRGAAIAVAEVDAERRVVTFAGVGNIGGAVLSPAEKRNVVSHNGTVGHQMRKVHEFTYPWGDDALLVLHSDGLGTHWSLDGYPGLASRHPSLIAGVLYRDFSRGRDDVTVVVVKRRAA